jgi:GNAT superfamily N-acetyltransferase
LSLDDGILLGSVNEKWQPCLAPLGNWLTDNTKFLRGPTYERAVSPFDLSTEALKSAYGLPAGVALDRLQDDDLELVMSLTHFRTYEYLAGRKKKSICVRVPDESRTNGVMTPVAWVLVHADGSLGTLHVQPEYRRHGLAKGVMRALVDSLAGSRDGHVGGTFGWFAVDVQMGNKSAERFFGALEGWNPAWQVGWMRIKADCD